MITLIAALQKKDRGIGNGPALLYHLPADMKHFKELTTSKVVIMGRATFDSLPDAFKPLPNRTNVVLTRNTEWSYPGVEVRHSVDEALKEFNVNNQEVMVIGGGHIYAEAIPFADKLELTIIDGDLPANVFFPEYETAFPNIVSCQEEYDSKADLTYTFETRTR